MNALRPLFFAALVAGLVAGGVSTVLHHAATVPLILRSEAFEVPHDHAGHDHGAAAWTPGDGAERIGFTVAADLLTGVAYAMLLAGALALRGGAMDWRRGALWGLAGFAAFLLAPSLGLPPALPGTEAAPVAQRQMWWVATALLTAVGLALILLKRRPWSIAAGLALILLPHLLGAPQPEVHAALAPPELTQRFVWVVLGTGLLFWLVLGAVSGWLLGRPGRASGLSPLP